MMKRLLAFAGLLVLAGWLLCAPQHVCGIGMDNIPTNHFFAFVDTSNGNHYTTANGGLVVAYEADLSDTAGQGINGTYYATSADTGFYWVNLPTNVYDFVFRDNTDTLIVAQNIPVWGRTLGDTTVTDSAQFDADVVGSHAIRDWAVQTAHLAANAVTAAKLADLAVDSAAVGTAAINPVHMNTTADYTFGQVDADSGLYVLEVQWDNGSGKIDGEQIADNTIDEDAIDWGSGAGQIDADDIAESATREWTPAAAATARIIVSDGLSDWQSVAMSGDVAITTAGATTIQDNSIDAEDLSSADDPGTGDYLSWTTSDAFTWQTAEERNIHVFSDVDTSMTFETTDPGAAASWLVYKAGVLVGDVARLFYIGTPGYYDNLGEKYTFDFGCTCRANDTLDCFKSPAVAKSAGSARLGGIIERWPWNGPNDPK